MIYYLGLCKISPQGVVICKHILFMKYWRPNHKLCIGFQQIKQSQNKKGWKFVSAERKTPFLVQLKQIFGPSCFDRALVANSNKHQVTHMIYVYTLQNKNKIDIMLKFKMPSALIWKANLRLYYWYIFPRPEATKDKVSYNQPSWYQISGGVRFFCLFFAKRSWSECNG